MLEQGLAGQGAVLTDERLKAVRDGATDPNLEALCFQFGRYLLVASSRAGGQPANLQGIWNESVSPPWGSKYTININTEMNYWPAEVCNLSELHEPLHQLSAVHRRGQAQPVPERSEIEGEIREQARGETSAEGQRRSISDGN